MGKDKRKRKEWDRLDVECTRLVLEELRRKKAMHEEAVRLEKTLENFGTT